MNTTSKKQYGFGYKVQMLFCFRVFYVSGVNKKNESFCERQAQSQEGARNGGCENHNVATHRHSKLIVIFIVQILVILLFLSYFFFEKEISINISARKDTALTHFS